MKARRLVYEAEKANDEARLDEAIALYEEAFGIWADIFEDYPILTIDDSAEDLFDSIRRYMVAIDTEEVPEDFPLKWFVRMMGQFGEVDPEMYADVVGDIDGSLQRRMEELMIEEWERERQIRAQSGQGSGASTDANAPGGATDTTSP